MLQSAFAVSSTSSAPYYRGETLDKATQTLAPSNESYESSYARITTHIAPHAVTDQPPCKRSSMLVLFTTGCAAPGQIAEADEAAVDGRAAVARCGGGRWHCVGRQRAAQRRGLGRRKLVPD